MHRICGKRIPGGEETRAKTTAGVKKKPMPWSRTLLHFLGVSLPLALCLSRFSSSLCRSNGHGEGSEAGGIRARVSEGISLCGCFMGMSSISNCFSECIKGKKILLYNHVSSPELPNNGIISTQPKPITTYLQ